MKVIFHLDLDSYFASASVTVQPHLKGKPIAITTGERRSIVAAASYEAKRAGVYVPMPFYKAQEVCPEVISVAPDYGLYTILSTKVFEFLSTYTKNIEVASIDEVYMDVTDIWQKYGSPVKLAKHIQEAVMKELDLPISIGISNNKFVAKMSTSINKPYGITVTKPGDFLKVAGDWELIKFHGIGGPTRDSLNALGVFTIGDLAKSKEEDVKEVLGARAVDYIEKANGVGLDELNLEHNALKGIGNSKTFQKADLVHRKAILEMLKPLVYKVAHRAEKRNMVGRVISLAIKESGGKDIKPRRKQVTLNRPIFKAEEIMEHAIKLFDDIWQEEPVKFIGVHLGKLEDMFETTYQMGIFDEEAELSMIEQIVADVNSKMKTKAVITGKEGRLNLKRLQNQSRYIESDRTLDSFKYQTKPRTKDNEVNSLKIMKHYDKDMNQKRKRKSNE